jgi:hypothetical protein
MDDKTASEMALPFWTRKLPNKFLEMKVKEGINYGDIGQGTEQILQGDVFHAIVEAGVEGNVNESFRRIFRPLTEMESIIKLGN